MKHLVWMFAVTIIVMACPVFADMEMSSTTSTLSDFQRQYDFTKTTVAWNEYWLQKGGWKIPQPTLDMSNLRISPTEMSALDYGSTKPTAASYLTQDTQTRTAVFGKNHEEIPFQPVTRTK